MNKSACSAVICQPGGHKQEDDNTILTNFLKNCQYGGQSSFPLGGSTCLNEDFKGKNNSGHPFGQRERYYSSITKDQLHHMPYNDNNYGPPNQ